MKQTGSHNLMNENLQKRSLSNTCFSGITFFSGLAFIFFGSLTRNLDFENTTCKYIYHFFLKPSISFISMSNRKWKTDDCKQMYPRILSPFDRSRCTIWVIVQSSPRLKKRLFEKVSQRLMRYVVTGRFASNRSTVSVLIKFTEEFEICGVFELFSMKVKLEIAQNRL